MLCLPQGDKTQPPQCYQRGSGLADHKPSSNPTTARASRTRHLQWTIKRAGKLWARVRPQLLNSKMTKRQQAVVVQTCLESGLLFDVATRSLQKGEIKKFQHWIDRRYRYIWSHKKEPPLKTMQRVQKNMQDVRSSLGIKSIRWKVEQRSLQRIGHVMRMTNDRPHEESDPGLAAI